MTTTCYHGGAFFQAIGDEFDALERALRVISADVLDAWFDPAPAVLDALREHLPFALRTSPPTNAEGMERVIARRRGVPAESVLAGAGSSDLIFLALRHWLAPRSRVLILDPMYGEYRHVLERVIGCRVERLTLDGDESFVVDPDRLACAVRHSYDLVVLVNPNSPTGQHMPRADLERVISRSPARFWIDETYVDYVGAHESLEQFAARTPNVVVCKSMSKMYALSGARSAYLCGSRPLIDELRSITPPWSVSLPAQIAACAALGSTDHYEARWRETHALREKLATGLRALGWRVWPSVANFLLCEVPDGPALLSACRDHGLFLRDASTMGRNLGPNAVRVAVKDAATNQRMIDIIARSFASVPGFCPRANVPGALEFTMTATAMRELGK
jgi:histidinol-phosphate/aromatic aminotransferase/cobyric acid decarboxylase-like protein